MALALPLSAKIRGFEVSKFRTHKHRWRRADRPLTALGATRAARSPHSAPLANRIPFWPSNPLATHAPREHSRPRAGRPCAGSGRLWSQPAVHGTAMGPPKIAVLYDPRCPPPPACGCQPSLSYSTNFPNCRRRGCSGLSSLFRRPRTLPLSCRSLPIPLICYFQFSGPDVVLFVYKPFQSLSSQHRTAQAPFR